MANAIVNPGFEEAPPFTAATSTAQRWIDGTASGSSSSNTLCWTVVNGGLTATANVQYDTSVSHSGNVSMKLSTLDATGVITVASYPNTNPNGLRTIISLLPLTTYTMSAWIKTNNVATNSAGFDIREWNSSLSIVQTSSSSRLSGTNDWTQIIKTFTTTATTAMAGILLRNSVAGSIGQAWFDDLFLDDANGGFVMYNNVGLGR